MDISGEHFACGAAEENYEHGVITIRDIPL